MRVPTLKLACNELKYNKKNFINGVKTKKVKKEEREKLLQYIKSLQEK
jgi:hypothetical protein